MDSLRKQAAHPRTVRRGGAALTAVLLATAAVAAPVPDTAPLPVRLPGEAEVLCDAAGAGLSCRYRLLPPGQSVTAIGASLDGTELRVRDHQPYPHEGSISTILFLVDPGGAATPALLDREREAIRAVLAGAADHHRFGIATIDNELQLLELPVNDAASITDSLARLQPSEKPTELYRTTLIAVRLLAKQTTDRKGIVLLSDGRAEDTAYFPRDVIEAARQGQVVINSIGFPTGPEAVTELQSLRRLSDETGGEFVAADAAGLAADFLEAPFQAVDYGGTFLLQDPGGRRLSGTLEVRLATASGQYTTTMPVTLAEQVPARPSPPPPRPRGTVRPVEADAGPSLLDLALLGGLLAMFGLVAYVLVRRLKASPPPRPWAEQSEPHRPPPETDGHGRLEFALEPERSPVALQGESFRVGRNADNDIRLEDSSVSRHHAQIHRGADGAYVVSDLNSLNGVFVNGRQVQSSQLKDGDKLEIGDVVLTFRLAADEA